ncbi:helix-turn-helix transcriptional regulator [Victivallis vadensis]|uniref:helix-turn-helix transcriptional regulator n=1 Tax=Victivallis vadensis TaxID=172901 RepID=UPI0023F2A2B8|nr:helix-turn-helix domain-containing protein [Victivallis vadensis]
MKNMQITPAATSIPAPILAAATAMLKPYGVDIVALLDEQQEATDTVQPLQKKYLTIKEARSYTGLGRWTLWKAEKEGKIKAIKFVPGSRCSRVLYDRASVDSWLESCAKRPEAEA